MVETLYDVATGGNMEFTNELEDINCFIDDISAYTNTVATIKCYEIFPFPNRKEFILQCGN